MEEYVSKSQKKREADFLKKVGTQLIDLSLAKLNALALPEHLHTAIVDAKSIKSHGAKKRQVQLIGKLLRAADYEKILATYEQFLEEDKATTSSFHQLEHWRNRLINEGKEALTAFIEAYQPQEIQHLRQLIKKAVDDQHQGKNTGAALALFRYLRSCIV